MVEEGRIKGFGKHTKTINVSDDENIKGTVISYMIYLRKHKILQTCDNDLKTQSELLK